MKIPVCVKLTTLMNDNRLYDMGFIQSVYKSEEELALAQEQEEADERLSNSEQVIESEEGDNLARRQLYKNRFSGKTDSRRIFSREYDFPKAFSLTENQFSRKTNRRRWMRKRKRW